MVSKAGAASLPEAPVQSSAATQGRCAAEWPAYNPVVTLNGWTLPWRMKDGVKEFHLVAEPVVREIAPGMKANLWGYNGQSPARPSSGGGRPRAHLRHQQAAGAHQRALARPAPAQRHGRRDGADAARHRAGQDLRLRVRRKNAGTFMYHPHADEMAQMAMGMMGFWVTHPRDPKLHAVDRDFVFLLNAYDIDPGSYTPKQHHADFNLWTFNSRAFPGIDPMVVRKNDRCASVGNLTMTNHPIHLHGHTFEVTGTDGGWVPPSARWPEVTDIAVGQMRAIELVADDRRLGLPLPQVAPHHERDGPHVPTMIGVDHSVAQDQQPGAGLHGHGRQGRVDGRMEMPLPENTLPMMTGEGRSAAWIWAVCSRC
jgi:hypothetical protein